MQNLYYVPYEFKVMDEEINLLINKMADCVKDLKNKELEFFYTIYNFKAQRTKLGFSDLILDGDRVIKKADLLNKVFGISKGTYSKIIKVCERFVSCPIGQSPRYIDLVANFSSSKLFELLALNDEQLRVSIMNNVIYATMPLRELRKKIKEILNPEIEDIDESSFIPDNEDEVPPTVDVREGFTMDELKKYKKEELIKMYLDLQMAYFKQKNKKVSAPKLLGRN